MPENRVYGSPAFFTMNKEKIQQLLDTNRLDEARTLLEGQQDAWALFMLGRIEWKLGHKSRAISLYAQSAELEPDGSAATALEQARQIMDFYNKDLYNP